MSITDVLAGGSLKMQFFISILVFVEENRVDSTGNRESVYAHITPIRSLPEGTHGGKILSDQVGNTANSLHLHRLLKGFL